MMPEKLKNRVPVDLVLSGFLHFRRAIFKRCGSDRILLMEFWYFFFICIMVWMLGFNGVRARAFLYVWSVIVCGSWWFFSFVYVIKLERDAEIARGTHIGNRRGIFNKFMWYLQRGNALVINCFYSLLQWFRALLLSFEYCRKGIVGEGENGK